MQKKSNPEFIVIAGPNGAGKSATSRKLLEPFGVEAFDWDEQFQSKWRHFGYDPAIKEGIRQSVNSDFQSHIEEAFSANASVAYETNFHSDYNFELAQRATSLSYNCSLYFLALNNPELGIQRVAQRVQKGGHHVSEPTIRERFRLGLEMLDSAAAKFYNRIFIYDSGKTFRLLLIIENEKIIHKTDHLVSEIINRLPNIKTKLNRLIQ
ncbi:MAG: zeta toxin family protein [Bacteroidota bacterium]